MELKHIRPEDIREALEIEEEFQDIDQFCAYLETCIKGSDNTNVRVGIRRLVKNIAPEERPSRRTFEENVAWIRANCFMGEKPEAPKAAAKQEPKPKIPSPVKACDFDQIRNDYETSLFKEITPLEDEDLDYSADIVLREGGIITQQKGFEITCYRGDLDLDTGKALITEAEGNQVLALGRLARLEDGRYSVIFDKKEQILYDRFAGRNQFRLVVFSGKGQGYSRIFDMDFEPFSTEHERPLCIDFGTSNTTAGSYGIKDPQKDEAEVVPFIDVTVTPNKTDVKLLPTVIYVEDCSDSSNIRYLFGYEARRRIEEEHYESKASVFYEIKRWISSANETEEIRDSKNNRAKPARKSIIKAYLDYVIECAEQYFETRFDKLHFSAPVKLKEQFLSILTELYRGQKEILSGRESIDEGIAIVYNRIITLMYNDINNHKNQEKSIMILDCGGGTTDLASCDYSYKETDAGVELTLKTGFENGNSNFGGNNITYRILQLLKIKIAAAYRPDLMDDGGEMIRLIDKSENSILGIVERAAKGAVYNSDQENHEVYEKFLDNYHRAETVIPTIFTGNERYRGFEELKKIRRNFYYLWRKAEQIKIDFYKNERVVMDFSGNREDQNLMVADADNYYLYFADEKTAKLQRVNDPLSKVSITIKEINRAICGDVYALLCGLFEDKTENHGGKKVEDFDYYKLSGQSCKITLFSELLKEYIPGRKLRPAIRQNGEKEKRESEELKLDCILGSIHYVRDQMRPEMKVITEPQKPKFIYNVWIKGTHTGNRRLFDCQRPDKILAVVSHRNTKEYPIIIAGKDEVKEREFIFRLADAEPGDELWTTTDIENKLLRKGNVEEGGVKEFLSELKEMAGEDGEPVNVVFALPPKDGYGIYLGQIQARDSQDRKEYRFLKFEYESFEDASKTFFDGKR